MNLELAFSADAFVSNAALGLGDIDDRTYPELVHIEPREDLTAVSKMDILTRFSPIYVRQIRMSRLHTAIVTNDTDGNLRLCGFGNGGRFSDTNFFSGPVH